MKTVNNVLVMDSGDIDKPEYRAAAVAALEADGGVSIPNIGLSLNKVGATFRLVDLNVGIDKIVTGKTATEIVDTIAAYGSAERILAVLGS